MKERANCLKTIRTALDGDKRAELAKAMWSYARPESPSELGALKVFKITPEGKSPAPLPGSDEYEAIERLKNEIAVLSQGRPGLPKLLHSSLKDRWLVTEYFPERTLHQHPLRYRGKPTFRLRVFRSLVETVASLHKDGYVHRDIKPPNVFLRNGEDLVLGDFGIVYVPTTAERLTLAAERVGPRDYMPPWAHRGKRVENVEPNWDVYMLGKLLWSMLDGRPFLPKEDYKDPDFDLTQTFPNDRNMQIINEILAQCVVKDPKECLKSAQELLGIVDGSLDILERGMPMLNREGKLSLPCHMCGKGFYQESNPGYTQVQGLDSMNVHVGGIRLRVFICNVCFHYEFFAPGFPDEAPNRGWTP